VPARRQRLDRFLSAFYGINRKQVKALLASRQFEVNGARALDCDQLIDAFSCIRCEGEVLQDKQAIYLMLHKPAGVVSATVDEHHRTVIDLIDHPDKHSLHIVGRLDLNSSGLVLLTNDSRWSRSLMEPGRDVAKVYQVTLGRVIEPECIEAFAAGMYFPYEDLTTRPAVLERVSDTEAIVTLVEGRYHQIKRMFGRFRNPVLALHRVSVGGIMLDPGLASGHYRHLYPAEII